MGLNEVYRPIADYIVVESKEIKTNAGLLLINGEASGYVELIVVAVGNDVKYVSLGDKVEIAHLASTIELGYKFDKYKTDKNSKLIQIREHNIMGVLNEVKQRTTEPGHESINT